MLRRTARFFCPSSIAAAATTAAGVAATAATASETPTTIAAAASSSASSSSSSSSSIPTINRPHLGPGKRIAVTKPVVMLEGDEMAQVMFQWVRDRLVLPFVDIEKQLELFDLGLQNRDATNDVVTELAADAILQHGVGIKCATITPDEARASEFNLKKMWKSPNGTIRHKLNGTVFREPIMLPPGANAKQPVPRWSKPIVICRHGFGDVYRGVDARFGRGKLELVFTPSDGGAVRRIEVAEFTQADAGGDHNVALNSHHSFLGGTLSDGSCGGGGGSNSSGGVNAGGGGGAAAANGGGSSTSGSKSGGGKAAAKKKSGDGSGGDAVGSANDVCGVGMAMFNTRSSIECFAKCCFEYSLQRRMPLVLTTKNTIMRHYDGLYIQTFMQMFERSYKTKFDTAGIAFSHRLVDDQVAQALKGTGGFMWACKNYDGDVQADFVAGGFGSLGLMSSVLFSADGRAFESEVGHGTVTRHFREHQKGRETSTNPMATIFAWSRGLAQRGRYDDNAPLVQFADLLEKASLATVEQGIVTKDIARLIHGDDLKREHYKNTLEFIEAIHNQLSAMLRG